MFRPARPERRGQDDDGRDLRRSSRSPTRGDVEVLGDRWHGDGHALRLRLGIQLQETKFPEKLRVHEVVALFRSFYPRGLTSGTCSWLVGLEEKADAHVRTLSGGQKQRLSLGCALVGDPELLFLDEPTTGLDPQSRRQTWDIVEGLKARGRTVLLTTHYMEEAERLCDRVAIVDHGKIIALGTPAGADRLAGRRARRRVRHRRSRRTRPSTRPDAWRCQVWRSVARDGGQLALDASARCIAPCRRCSPRCRSATPRRRSSRPTTPRWKTSSWRSPDGGCVTAEPRAARPRQEPTDELTKARVRELMREPEAVFWVFVFPILLAGLLGLAFRSRPPEALPVAVVAGTARRSAPRPLSAGADLAPRILSAARGEAGARPRPGAAGRLERRAAVVWLRSDATRKPRRAARRGCGASARRGPRRTRSTRADGEVTAAGSRYVDFLVPGLLGMNLMGTGMWGVGFSLVIARNGNLLKRLVAAPAQTQSHPGGAAHLSADFSDPGSGRAAPLRPLRARRAAAQVRDPADRRCRCWARWRSAGSGLLTAARPRTIEGVSGIMNLVMVPMWIFSGIFFSTERFPAAHAAVRSGACR